MSDKIWQVKFRIYSLALMTFISGLFIGASPAYIFSTTGPTWAKLGMTMIIVFLGFTLLIGGTLMFKNEIIELKSKSDTQNGGEN